ncbi:RagB/SusD domain-containing protein (plasmid) [Gemmatirosa kalamazoonensis]|uniref:RagB/SusD domain-containing protein n=1 Tax=Gemmatirosa kalamazoonensis TaxID=861299 RepID=W0RT59_9BACT|nr:RagB/SusD family nutrient uptake outer membrane protein [Gemmatirosa kalamazoonensis]AHG93657.1 RagB/SusD domain-containing protein [Gemmatirosa kalamazoonensis]
MRYKFSTLVVALAAVNAAACDKLLSVDNPGRVPAETLADPALMPALEAGALQQFQCGWEQYVVTAGTLSGEYWVSNGFIDSHPWEWRGIAEIKANPGGCATTRGQTFMGFYTPLQQARFQLEDLGKRAAAFTDAQLPNRTRIQAEAAAYAGYTYVLLGEGMCDMTIDNGPKISRADVFKLAEQRFTEALGFAGTSTDTALVNLRNMAYVGRARERLDAGNLAGAAADAALVPAGYVRVAEYTEGGAVSRENRLYNMTIRNDFLSVAPAYRGLTLENGQPDPRVRVVQPTPPRAGNDNVTPMWQQQKFIAQAGGTPLPIASYAEAQLILAEATGGQAGLAAINRVRALSNIPAITTLPADFQSLIIEERRRQLFSEGQRYGDMLRFNIPFQSGTNRKGQTYSTLTCVPLPDVETRNNPNLGS